MKNSSLFVSSLLITLLSGCSVIKTPSISQTDKDSGRIQTSYTFGLFEKPDVKTDITLSSVNSQCKGWGYQDAKQTAGPNKNCIQKDQNGNCTSWEVNTLYECNITPEQQSARNEKKQKDIQAQQETVARAEKAQQEFINNLSSYTVRLACEGNGAEQIVKHILYDLYRTDYRVGDGGEGTFRTNVNANPNCGITNTELSKNKALSLLQNGKYLGQKNGIAYFSVNMGNGLVSGIFAR